MKDQYVLEWSKKQNAFHIQPLISSLANNQAAFIEDKPTTDYIVLMVGEKEACHTMADNHRYKIKSREKLFAYE